MCEQLFFLNMKNIGIFCEMLDIEYAGYASSEMSSYVAEAIGIYILLSMLVNKIYATKIFRSFVTTKL